MAFALSLGTLSCVSGSTQATPYRQAHPIFHSQLLFEATRDNQDMFSDESAMNGYLLHESPGHIATALQVVLTHSAGKLSQISVEVINPLGICETIRLCFVLFTFDGKAVFCDEQWNSGGFEIALLYIAEHLAKGPRHVEQEEGLSWVTNRLASHRMVMCVVGLAEEVTERIHIVIGRSIWQSPRSGVAVQPEAKQAGISASSLDFADTYEHSRPTSHTNPSASPYHRASIQEGGLPNLFSVTLASPPDLDKLDKYN